MSSATKQRPRRRFYRTECRKRDDGLPRGSPEQVNWHIHGIRLALSDGRDADALTELEGIRELGMGPLEKNFMWSVMTALLADATARLGRPEDTEPLYTQLLPYAAYNVQNSGAVAYLGATSHYLGMLATRLGRWEATEAHLADAIAMHQRMGAEALLAHSRLEWAQMLTTRSQPGDGERARRLLDSVEVAALRVGLAVVGRRASRLRAVSAGGRAAEE